VEPHYVSWKHKLANRAQVKDRVVREEVRDNVITSLKFDTAGYFASLCCVCVLLSVKQREKVHFPSNTAALDNNIGHLGEFNTLMNIPPVHSELFLCLKSNTAFWASHFEGCFKLHVLIPVHLHLLGMVFAVFLLPYFMLWFFPMLL